ncbi:MAG: ribosomal protein S18-alanine N-acetyltransferase [Proteobacteria bacterium]|nr:ribosomal protein S18-alanine N-acetyltransferase [Pseudomonadota bacterium]MBS0572631.1 ribosomal protein S18-alanine N-acetyltransferase [Pseudomonadota bacterium]
MTAADLARIHAACFASPRPWTAAEFAALLGPGPCFLLEEPGGFALGRVIADEAELLTIAVLPEARNRGMGRRLLAGFLREAAARGAATAFLEVGATNESALALYRKAGFRAAGRRPGYYRDAGLVADALVLRLSLSSSHR